MNETNRRQTSQKQTHLYTHWNLLSKSIFKRVLKRLFFSASLLASISFPTYQNWSGEQLKYPLQSLCFLFWGASTSIHLYSMIVATMTLNSNIFYLLNSFFWPLLTVLWRLSFSSSCYGGTKAGMTALYSLKEKILNKNYRANFLLPVSGQHHFNSSGILKIILLIFLSKTQDFPLTSLGD